MSTRLRTRLRRAAVRAQHTFAFGSPVLLAVAIAAATIACGSSADLVTGPSGTKCQVTLEAPPNTVDPGGATIGIAVRTQAECTWTASSTASWVASLPPASGQGNGEVRVQVSANPLPSSRQAEVIVNDSRASVQQAAAACRFEVTPATRVVAAAATSGAFSVATLAGCSWRAVTNVGWIRIESGESGVGAGDVTFAVTANEGPARNGSLTIAGAAVTVTQEAALVEPPPAPVTPAPTPTPTPPPPPPPTPTCNNDITPSAATIAAAGGTQRIAVAALSGCRWTAESNVSWITIVSGAAGVGPGAVELLIAPNSGGARTATLVIAGRQLSVAQDAAAAPDPAPAPTPPPPTPTPPPCTYTVAPADVSIAATGGAGSPIAVTTATGCTWTAAATVPWLAITSGATGSGSGTVTFTAESNTGSQRTGTLTIAGQTVTVRQAAASTPPPTCVSSISPTADTVGPAGTTGRSFMVKAQPSCGWTAVSSATWLTITSEASGTGNGRVDYAVAALTTATRTATISIGGQTFSVTQSGPTP